LNPPTTTAGGLYPLHGVIGIPQTPFDSAGNVDLPSFERGIEDRIDAGVGALLYPAVASEVDRLLPEERARLFEALVGQTDGRIRIIAGASSSDPDLSLSTARAAAQLGVAGILVQAPPELGGDVARLHDYFSRIADQGPDMLMIQDLDWRGVGLPIATILRLFESIPQFRCIKVETTLAGLKYSALLKEAGGELNVSGGWASSQLIEALDRGLHATACGGHHHVYQAIVTRYHAGDRPGARKIFDALLPIIAFTSQHIDISNRFNKMCAVRRGLYETDLIRAPQIEMDSHHLNLAEELVSRLVQLEESLRPAHPGGPTTLEEDRGTVS
jgi:dihydrodipicolinate synthase/N-acetylneuraminate lyase